uniref:Uncharacterized protein n=1 Tax=Physcomitrium patens TaxID=3218 RepID=A0A2K1K087_PHYPA|nr:hypothetical protein PHYPA_014307 [Physcomitrium patens]
MPHMMWHVPILVAMPREQLTPALYSWISGVTSPRYFMTLALDLQANFESSNLALDTNVSSRPLNPHFE